MALADDFGISMNAPSAQAKVSDDKAKGTKRTYLKVFETMPPQLLNAYGASKYAKLDDAQVWQELSKPLKSGAQYVTELCSLLEERRGIGLNRFFHALLLYCKYQVDPENKKRNQVLLQQEKFNELYAEIDRSMPALEYCLAPKKEAARTGAAGLRSSVSDAPVSQRTPELLDAHAKTLYEWLDTAKPSRIRMLVHWQAAAGMSLVAAVYHRGAQAFRYQGNSLHDVTTETTVSLEAFQCAVKERHVIGNQGIEPQRTGDNNETDF